MEGHGAGLGSRVLPNEERERVSRARPPLNPGRGPKPPSLLPDGKKKACNILGLDGTGAGLQGGAVPPLWSFLGVPRIF